MNDAGPDGPTSAAPRHWRRWLVVALAAALLAAAATVTAAVVGIGPFSAPTLAVEGMLSIEADRTPSGNCQGQGQFADIHGGTSIVVRDAQGRSLATGALQPGRAGPFGTGCSFEFAITVPAGKGSYQFSIAQRVEAATFAEADMNKRIMLYYEFGELFGIAQ
jgi:hypothetical protein